MVGLGIGVVTVALTIGAPERSAAQPVDIELVLAVDGSGSVSRPGQELERTGLSQAFRAREVIAAIGALPRGLARALVGFAGVGQTRRWWAGSAWPTSGVPRRPPTGSRPPSRSPSTSVAA